MRRWILITLLCAGVHSTGLAHADEATVGCGEACDSEMNQSTRKIRRTNSAPTG